MKFSVKCYIIPLITSLLFLVFLTRNVEEIFDNLTKSKKSSIFARALCVLILTFLICLMMTNAGIY